MVQPVVVSGGNRAGAGGAGASVGVLDRPLGGSFDLQGLLDDVARHYLQRAMTETRGVKKEASDLLRIKNYQTMTNWLKKLKIYG